MWHHLTPLQFENHRVDFNTMRSYAYQEWPILLLIRQHKFKIPMTRRSNFEDIKNIEYWLGPFSECDIIPEFLQLMNLEKTCLPGTLLDPVPFFQNATLVDGWVGFSIGNGFSFNWFVCSNEVNLVPTVKTLKERYSILHTAMQHCGTRPHCNDFCTNKFTIPPMPTTWEILQLPKAIASNTATGIVHYLNAHFIKQNGYSKEKTLFIEMCLYHYT